MRAKETGITAIRLECLTHESLPHSGAGRAFNSNFVLSEFELEIVNPNKKVEAQRIKFKRATADYSQNNYNIAASIDGNKGTGWAVDGPTKKENRVAMFVADKPQRTRPARPGRRHINLNNQRPYLKEDLAQLFQDIKRCIFGIGSAGFVSFLVFHFRFTKNISRTRSRHQREWGC